MAFATGGWRPSALLKLRVAEIMLDEAVFACADDARTRTDIVRLARDRAESFYERRFDRVVSVGDGVWDEFWNALDAAAPPTIAERAAVMPPTNVL